MNINLIGKYYGPYKIRDLADSDKKTFLGDKYVNVIFDNGITELLPEKIINIVATDEKSDFTSQQNKLFDVIIPQMLGILADYDLTLFDTAGLINRMDMSIKQNYRQAVGKLFKKDCEDKITLMQIQEVLTKK